LPRSSSSSWARYRRASEARAASDPRADDRLAHAVMSEPRIRISALLSWNEMVLLCRHEKAERGEYWLLPGGGVDSGESLLNALYRALREVVGIEDQVPLEGPLAIVCSIAPA